MKILKLSLEQSLKSDELANHLNRLRNEDGWFKQQFVIVRKLATTMVLIALGADGLPIGVMMVDEDKRGGVFVDPTYRRRGIATALLREAYNEYGAGIMVCCDDTIPGRELFCGLRSELELKVYAELWYWVLGNEAGLLRYGNDDSAGQSAT